MFLKWQKRGLKEPMLNRFRGSNTLFFFIAISIPLFLTISWHVQNKYLPYADYYETAQNIFLKYHNGGMFDAIKSAYLERGRPIFFPVLIAPVIIMTGGDILLSTALTLTAIFFIFLTYVYFLFCYFIPRSLSVFGTVYIGTLVWVQTFSDLLYSELFLMLCFIALIYHLIKSSHFFDIRHVIYFSLWLSLGVLIRPIEFLSGIFVIFVFEIIKMLKKSRLQILDLLLFFTIFSVTLLLFYAVVFLNFTIRSSFFVASGIVVFQLLSLKLKNINHNFFVAILIFNLCNIMWWLPGIQQLYGWVQFTTGVVGSLYHEQGKMSFLKALWKSIEFLGAFPLFALFGVSFIAFFDQKFFTRNSIFVKKIQWRLIVSILTIVLPIFLLSQTTDFSLRRFLHCFVFIHIMFFTVAVSPDYILKKTRLTCILLLISMQFLSNYFRVFDILPHIQLKAKVFFPPITNTVKPSKDDDPSLKLFNVIVEKSLDNVRMAAFTLARKLTDLPPFHSSLDITILNVLAKKSYFPLSFNKPYIFYSLKEGYEQLKTFDYVLVDVSSQTPPYAYEKSKNEPYAQLTLDLIQKWKEKKYHEVGLEWSDSFQVKDKKFVLFKIQGRSSELMRYESNMAHVFNGAIARVNIQTENNFSIRHLNDGDIESVWGSVGGTQKDTFFYVVRKEPYKADQYKIVLFTGENGGHIKDVAVVATNDEINGSEKWIKIKARIGDGRYMTKLTIPEEVDFTVVTIEIDKNDPHWREYQTWGLACFSESGSYDRNYVKNGDGIYLRELQISKIR